MSNAIPDSPHVLTIKIGRRVYDIAERDVFMDNGACIQLLSQAGPLMGYAHTRPVLPVRECRRIAAFERVEIQHTYGPVIKVFRIKRPTDTSTK